MGFTMVSPGFFSPHLSCTFWGLPWLSCFVCVRVFGLQPGKWAAGTRIYKVFKKEKICQSFIFRCHVNFQGCKYLFMYSYMFYHESESKHETNLNLVWWFLLKLFPSILTEIFQVKKLILVIGDWEFRLMMCKESRPVANNEALDIQSYLLRFGVLGMFLGSKYLLRKRLDV